MIEGNKKKGVIGTVIAIILSLIGYQVTPDHFTNFLLPNEQIFNVAIEYDKAQAYALDNNLELIACIPEISYCQFRGTLSLYFHSLSNPSENDGELGISPPIPGEPKAVLSRAIEFNDPEYPSQWNLQRAGFSDALMAGLTCESDVKLAVLDTGYAGHSDLQSYYVCDTTQSGTCGDGHGHGTHVLGTLAMIPNNALGGIGTSPGCALISIKVLGDNGQGSFFEIAAGIIKAVREYDADVINMSLGADTTTPGIIKSALDFAERAGRDGKGTVVVAAAGNRGLSKCGTPANYDTVLCVGALDDNDRLAGFSNRGVDVVGPGTNIFSTITKGEFANWSGTSMASPHVAAAIALFLAQDENKMTAAEIRDYVIKHAEPVSGCPDCANGLVNVMFLLNEPEPTPTPRPTEPTTCTVTVSNYPGDRATTWDAWNLIATSNQLMKDTFMLYQEVQREYILHIQADNQATCQAWETIFQLEGFTTVRSNK
jgi:thermitase